VDGHVWRKMCNVCVIQQSKVNAVCIHSLLPTTLIDRKWLMRQRNCPFCFHTALEMCFHHTQSPRRLYSLSKDNFLQTSTLKEMRRVRVEVTREMIITLYNKGKWTDHRILVRFALVYIHTHPTVYVTEFTHTHKYKADQDVSKQFMLFLRVVV